MQRKLWVMNHESRVFYIGYISGAHWLSMWPFIFLKQSVDIDQIIWENPETTNYVKSFQEIFSLFAYLRIWLPKSKRFLNAFQYAFGVRLIFFLLANFLEIIVSACSILHSLGKWLQRLSCLHIKRPEVKELKLEGQWKTFFVYFR